MGEEAPLRQLCQAPSVCHGESYGQVWLCSYSQYYGQDRMHRHRQHNISIGRNVYTRHNRHLSSVHSAGLSGLGHFLESLIGRQCGSPQQTESHSFGDPLISEVLHHQVLEKVPAIVLCSVSLWLM
jgi:hypothetical protein